jgi:hypothetical protein
MKFRKKPVVVEAEQYNGQTIEGVCTHVACKNMTRYKSEEDFVGFIVPHIHTLEGTMEVWMRDWVITGVMGEKYPCKPDVFEATYEPAE